jgi:hypothetical protein
MDFTADPLARALDAAIAQRRNNIAGVGRTLTSDPTNNLPHFAERAAIASTPPQQRPHRGDLRTSSPPSRS